MTADNTKPALNVGYCPTATGTPTPALVALSYASSPLLDVLYPPVKWRRIVWSRPNHMQRLLEVQERVTEVLLCNYERQDALWSDLRGDSLAERPGDVCF